MPMFRVFYSYIDRSGATIKGSHTTQMDTPADANRATVSKLKPFSKDGIIIITKTKRVRL